MHRFFIPPADWDPDALALEGQDAHHCADVLRLEPGAKVAVFNGRGGEATAEITDVSKGRVALKRLHLGKSPAVKCRIALAQAIPKGKNMDLIVQKATELGASDILPVVSERTVVRIDNDEGAKKAEKWRQVVIEAGKQCGRNWLPGVANPRALKDLLEVAGDYDLLIIASLQDDRRTFKEVIQEYRDSHDGADPASVLLLIGPEGDFTPAECALARSHQCRPVTLGPIVLRTETAAIYSLSVLANELF